MGVSNKLETRAESYSDTLISAILSRAQGKSLAIPDATGGRESNPGL